MKLTTDVNVNTGVPVWDLVVADMRERGASGRAKYGTPLQTHNGRRALVAAYQELLDLVVYLRQEIAEREGITAADVELLRQQLRVSQEQLSCTVDRLQGAYRRGLDAVEGERQARALLADAHRALEALGGGR